MKDSQRVLLAPVTTMASAVGVMLILVLGMRGGDVQGVGLYGAGLSASSLLMSALSGGGTLKFVSGTEMERATVARYRFRIAVPIAALAVVAIVLLNHRTGVNGAIVLGALSGVVANLNELSNATLQREVRHPTLLVGTVVSRTLGVASVSILGSYAVAMFLSTVTLWLVNGLAAGTLWLVDGLAAGNSAENQSTRRVRTALPTATGWPWLYVLAVAAQLQVRIPVLTAAALCSATDLGYFVALVSAQQSLMQLATSGMYASMAARAGAGDPARLDEIRRIEVVLVVMAVIGAAVSIGLVSTVLSVLGIEHKAAGLWWIVLVSAIPAGTLARLLQYRLNADRADRAAMNVALAGAAGSLAAALCAMGTGLLWVLAAIPLVGELAAVAAGTNLVRRRPRR